MLPLHQWTKSLQCEARIGVEPTAGIEPTFRGYDALVLPLDDEGRDPLSVGQAHRTRTRLLVRAYWIR